MGAVRRSRLYYSVGGGEREREIDREVMANWRGRNCRSTCEFSFHRCPCPPNSLSLSLSLSSTVGAWAAAIYQDNCNWRSAAKYCSSSPRNSEGGRPFAFLIADTDALFSLADSGASLPSHVNLSDRIRLCRFAAMHARSAVIFLSADSLPLGPEPLSAFAGRMISMPASLPLLLARRDRFLPPCLAQGGRLNRQFPPSCHWRAWGR